MTGPTMLRCEPYACDLEELACGLRFKTAKTGDGGVRMRLSHCIGCEVGKGNAAKHRAALAKFKRVKKGRRWNPNKRDAQGFAAYVKAGQA